MDEIIHGGDIYRNSVKMDFSVNINPLKIPESVKNALHFAVEQCEFYPDIQAKELITKLAKSCLLESKYIVCGNGASELFMAIVHAIRPKNILIPVPSFYGYEKAAKASNAKIIYYEMQEEAGFSLKTDFLDEISEDIRLIFLASPNNPVGNIIEPTLLEQICKKCCDLGIYVVIDECFIEFTRKASFEEQQKLSEYPNVIIVKAFTKIYAIPGVRLGYLLCENSNVCKKIREQLPEWNLSTFAQMAGIAAIRERDYVQNTIDYVQNEREYLVHRLKKMKIKVWDSDVNFLLIRTQINLYEELLTHQILIRDCSNYIGLKKGFYRIAVKTHKENKILMNQVGEILDTELL